MKKEECIDINTLSLEEKLNIILKYPLLNEVIDFKTFLGGKVTQEAINSFHSRNIYTIRDLYYRTSINLLGLPNVGEATVAKLQSALDERELPRLPENYPPLFFKET